MNFEMALVKISKWDTERDGPLSSTAVGQKLKSKGYHYFEHKYEAGSVLHEHSHKEPRKDAIISGDVKVDILGSEVFLKAGDILDVPVGVDHTFTAIGSALVVMLEGELGDLVVEPWNPTVDGVLSLESMGKKLAAQGFTYLQQVYGPGSVLNDHAHREPTRDAVVSGQMKVSIFGKEVLVGAGDIIEIPAGAQHKVSVVGSQVCMMYEAGIVDLNISHWNISDDGSLTLENLANKLKSLGYHYKQQCYAPGTIFHEHSHDKPTKDAILSGKLGVNMQGKTVTLLPGDILDIPANVEHNATVLGDEDVVVLEAEKGHIHRIHWNEAVDGALSEEALIRKIEYHGCRYVKQVYPPETVHNEHSHPEPRIDAVVSGQMLVTLFGQEIVLNPGDMLEIPMGTDHVARIGNEQTVVLEGEIREPNLDSWHPKKDGALTIENLGKKLKGRGYYYVKREFAPGTKHHDIAHQEARKTAVFSGQLKFGIFGKEIVLKAGDIVHAPIGLDHNTEVVGSEPVILLDAIKGFIKVERWNADVDGPISADSLSKKLKSSGYPSVQQQVYHPGTILHEHAHKEPRKDAVVSGQLKVSMFGREVALKPGDIIEVPEGVDHDAVVLGADPVILLEAAK